MLVTKMDLLNYQYLDKMNNNIGILCYEGEAALRGDPRMHQSMSLSSSGGTNHSHRTGPPPISPGKRKHSLSTGQDQQDNDDQDCDNQHVAKMSRLFAAQLGNYRSSKDPRDRSRSPIERAAAPSMGLHGNHHLYTPHRHMPCLAMDQPLALTKNNMDAARTLAISPTVSPVERQQNRPSVITCAPANNRNCNLPNNGCSNNLPNNGCSNNYSRRPASNSNSACVDPVIEEHFRRSLGRNYKQPEPVTNSVSITGSVDDHFTKALGETWLQIKAKGSSSSSPDSSPNSHMVNHNHSPSVVS
ncbi:transcription cofactor vestigial-like protein 4b isoform X1 [Oncorhynchus mykiss]|uniref:transcription cofactor vestigial-like protein 4b isoform X1 n=1 Tax=Oncorhynchus mykiss TaxID=8022 RepID=UPI0018784017|nr:transcription cofactor vestigial-like protein 4b isoform X1 [Oncorhynchus mykiss]